MATGSSSARSTSAEGAAKAAAGNGRLSTIATSRTGLNLVISPVSPNGGPQRREP
jgi:hypothetical protein